MSYVFACRCVFNKFQSINRLLPSSIIYNIYLYICISIDLLQFVCHFCRSFCPSAPLLGLYDSGFLFIAVILSFIWTLRTLSIQLKRSFQQKHSLLLFRLSVHSMDFFSILFLNFNSLRFIFYKISTIFNQLLILFFTTNFVSLSLLLCLVHTCTLILLFFTTRFPSCTVFPFPLFFFTPPFFIITLPPSTHSFLSSLLFHSFFIPFFPLPLYSSILHSISLWRIPFSVHPWKGFSSFIYFLKDKFFFVIWRGFCEQFPFFFN